MAGDAHIEAPRDADHDVASVFSGQRSYDTLAPAMQAVVRTIWAQGITEAIAGLDLAAEFEARGERYTELDAFGRIVTRRTTQA